MSGDTTRRVRFTKAQLRDIAERRARGESLRAIAAVYGVNHTTINYHLHHDGPRRTGRAEDGPRHGTNAGYHAHVRHGERPCTRCCDAHAQYMRELRQRRKADA